MPANDQDIDAVQSQNIDGLKKDLLRFFLAGLIPLFSGAAYLMGVAYHQTYLSTLHVPGGLIEKNTADYFIYAYDAVAGSVVRLITSALFLVLLLIFLGVFMWFAMDRLGKRLEKTSWAKKLRARVSPDSYLRTIGELLFIPLLITILVFYAIVALFFLLFLPEAVGSAAGHYRADQDLKAFNVKCDKVKNKPYFCNNIYEGDKLISQGFVFDSSEKFIVVYESSGAHVFSRENKSFSEFK